MTWADLRDHGFGDAVVAVALQSQPDADEHQISYLALVAPDGRARVIKGGEQSVWTVSAHAGVLCVPSTKHFYRITTSKGARYARPDNGLPYSGHWSGVTRDGRCVHVSNDGGTSAGYQTSVYVVGRSPGAGSTGVGVSIVRDVPDGLGIAAGAVWMHNAGKSSTLDGTNELHRVDLMSGAVSTTMSWPVWQGRLPGAPARTDFVSSIGSDIFEFKGSLFVVEDLQGVHRGSDSEVGIEPGRSEQVRLTRLDPGNRRLISSTFLYSQAGEWDTDPHHRPTPAQLATRRGCQFGDSVFRVTKSGDLVRINLPSRKALTIGHASRRLSRAQGAVASCAESKLSVLVVSMNWSATLETYDLTTGSMTSERRIDGLSNLLTGGQVDVVGMASLAD